MLNEIINQILSTAINAPSGDNSQPWSFSIHENGFDIFNLPDRDNPIFNYKQRGSYIAHGAIIYNIGILAPIYGYKATYTLFPEKTNPNKIASITLVKESSSNKNQKYIALIQKRSTNRKKYNKQPLEVQEKNNLISLAAELKLGNFAVTDDNVKIKDITSAASTAECVMLQYQPLHNAFFSMLRWNKYEEQKYKNGLLIDTLELHPPQKFIFKWFSNWNASKILRIIGLPNFVAKENSKTYASASAIGSITIKDNSPESFVKAGILLQALWLKATEMNLSIQPIAGVLYLGQRLTEAGIPDLPINLQILIQNSTKIINKSLNNTNILAMIFRIGKSSPPSAYSKKFLSV